MKNQAIEKAKEFTKPCGTPCRIVANIRHDDSCGNGKNSFCITGRMFENGTLAYCGRIDDEIAEHFPELISAQRFNNCFTDGPIHYVENALYWAGMSGYCSRDENDPPNWEYFKKSVVWGVSPSHDIGDPAERFQDPDTLVRWLNSRRYILVAEFRKEVESLGLKF